MTLAVLVVTFHYRPLRTPPHTRMNEGIPMFFLHPLITPATHPLLQRLQRHPCKFHQLSPAGRAMYNTNITFGQTQAGFPGLLGMCYTYQPDGSACSSNIDIVESMNQATNHDTSIIHTGRTKRRMGTINGSVIRARKRIMAYRSSMRNQEAIARTSIARMRKPMPNWTNQCTMGTGKPNIRHS